VRFDQFGGCQYGDAVDVDLFFDGQGGRRHAQFASKNPLPLAWRYFW
jgi:hypothetical protein